MIIILRFFIMSGFFYETTHFSTRRHIFLQDDTFFINYLGLHPMALTEMITEQMKTAMKSGDKIRLETLRSLRALILEFEKSGAGRTMNEEDEQKLLLSAAKKRKDAIEQFRAVGREEAMAKEEAELAIIQEFLPQQMSEAEVESVLRLVVEQVGATGAKDVGKVMGPAMKELRGKADGTLVQTVVKRLLGA
jgi:uncharacterized protein